MTSEIQMGFDERLLTLRELSEDYEIQNARLSFARLRAWAFIGFRGQKLPTILIGRVRYTTVERTLLFAAQCGILDKKEPQKTILPKSIPTRGKTCNMKLVKELYGKKADSLQNPK